MNAYMDTSERGNFDGRCLRRNALALALGDCPFRVFHIYKYMLSKHIYNA